MRRQQWKQGQSENNFPGTQYSTSEKWGVTGAFFVYVKVIF